MNGVNLNQVVAELINAMNEVRHHLSYGGGDMPAS
jgi:hypothetical protein